jgi:hypothetical protein
MNVDSSETAAVLIKCFRRIMPVLIEHADWEIPLTITKAVSQAARNNTVFSQDTGLPLKPHKFIFKGLTTELYEAYIEAEESQRQVIGRIAAKLGSQGIEILSRVLSDCDDRAARKEATDFLIKKGDLARRWVLKVLDDPNQPWYLQRNALMILRYVGKGEGDIDRARKLLGNTHPRLRDEALNTVLELKASDAEQLVEQILNIINAEPPEEKEDALRHIRKVSQLITSLGVLEGHRNLMLVEDTLLDIGQKVSGQKKGLLKRLKKSGETDQAPIISATITTLGKIGTPKSEAFLAKLAGGKTNQAEPILDFGFRIESHLI